MIHKFEYLDIIEVYVPKEGALKGIVVRKKDTRVLKSHGYGPLYLIEPILGDPKSIRQPMWRYGLELELIGNMRPKRNKWKKLWSKNV